MVAENTQETAARPQRRFFAGSKRKRQEAFWFYVTISPWLIGFLVFTLGPILVSLYLSFTDWDLFQAPNFIGFNNYVKLVTGDHVFWKALRNTLFYAALSVPLQMGISLFFAYLLNKPLKGMRFFRTAFYLPSLVPVVASSLLFVWLLAPHGLLNQGLALVGIDGPSWLLDADWVKPGLIIMSLWTFGVSILLLLAGMKGIPTELYESAAIDGANERQMYFKITLPLLTPIILFNLIIGIIAALQTFSQVYIMTQGGPNNASLMMSVYLFDNAFRFFKMGYASAIAWILFTLIMLLTLLIFRSSSAWVFYQNEVQRS